MRKRLLICVAVGWALLGLWWFSPRHPPQALSVQIIGLTNVSPENAAGPLFWAMSNGAPLHLELPTPSHVMLRITNNTSRTLDLLCIEQHQFRTDNGQESYYDEVRTFGPMTTALGELEAHTSRVVMVPRPPFDCTWRTAFNYFVRPRRHEHWAYTLQLRLNLGFFSKTSG